jgi:radical SAM superfamily enzyme YgiQ (UPF0313 family)
MPKWDIADINSYPAAPNGIFTRYSKIAPIISGRGCPFNCSFCASRKMLGKKPLKRPIEHLLNEILLLYNKYGIKEFHFMDDTFNWDKKYLVEFSRRIKEINLPICFSCPSGLHLEFIDEETLVAMESAGVYSIAVGIESGSQRILDLMGKRLTLDKIREKINLIKRFTKIKVTGFFIIGYPGETEKEIISTIEFAKELLIDRANFFNFTPFPGSDIYNELKNTGKLKGISSDKLYIHHIQYHPEGITRKKMAELQRRAYFSFYLRPKIIFGLIKEIKTFSQVKIILLRIFTILLQ